MSDFLDHLLGGGREEVASLAPRPVSINERPVGLTVAPEEAPAPAGDGLAGSSAAAARREPSPMGGPDEAGDGSRRPVARDDLRGRLDALQAWLARLDARHSEPPALAPAAGSASARPAPLGREDQAEAPREVSRPEPAGETRPAKAERTPPSPAPDSARARPREARRATEGVQPPRAVTAPRIEPAEPPRRERQGATPAPAIAHAPEVARVEVPVEAAPPRLAPRPVETPRPAARRQKPPEAPAQPVVQVTIGTIEVRATRAPAAQPAAQPSHAPNMSLDAYLRGRSRSGR